MNDEENENDYGDIKKQTDDFFNNMDQILNTKPENMSKKTQSKNNDKKERNTSQGPDQKIKEEGSSMKKIDKLFKEMNNKYIEEIKETEKKSRKNQYLYNELEKGTQELNKFTKVKREEDLLRLQQKNQEVDKKLVKLKNIDQSELISKKEQADLLSVEINEMFNEKREDILLKDKERIEAIKEIKEIKNEQQKIIEINKENSIKVEELQKEYSNLEDKVKQFESYKKFIDDVVENNEEFNKDYDKLKTKFENLINTRTKIEKDIKEQEATIKTKQTELNELIRKNDKQVTNQRLIQLDKESKNYLEENNKLEIQIEELLKNKQKKDSDTHQIKLSILNLYNKIQESQGKPIDTKFDSPNENLELRLCEKLDHIGERIDDLIDIVKELDN